MLVHSWYTSNPNTFILRDLESKRSESTDVHSIFNQLIGRINVTKCFTQSLWFPVNQRKSKYINKCIHLKAVRFGRLYLHNIAKTYNICHLIIWVIWMVFLGMNLLYLQTLHPLPQTLGMSGGGCSQQFNHWLPLNPTYCSFSHQMVNAQCLIYTFPSFSHHHCFSF